MYTTRRVRSTGRSLGRRNAWYLSRGDILHGRTALVIGFGKLGSSIARLLHAKGVRVTVYDVDPVRRTQALSQGFTANGLEDAGLVPNGGNAVNFLHGASVGPFIFLVQAEIIAASAVLAGGGLCPGMHEIGPADRAAIAATWLDCFNQ
ncbi:NAD(P)-dependent oxidoreductase [Streptomyces sp. NPDC017086]|uniref:NAD(P)-dependent oxidoreductase n=1 Tax=Streptomyces sp. NPDC017086 TaxID=3364976 RepID=UPI00379760CD